MVDKHAFLCLPDTANTCDNARRLYIRLEVANLEDELVEFVDLLEPA